MWGYIKIDHAPVKTTDIGPSRDEDSHTDPHSVAGRTIVITGGSSGIGAEIAADLVSAGATRLSPTSPSRSMRCRTPPIIASISRKTRTC